MNCLVSSINPDWVYGSMLDTRQFIVDNSDGIGQFVNVYLSCIFLLLASYVPNVAKSTRTMYILRTDDRLGKFRITMSLE